MVLRGDEATRLAIDALVELVSGRDMARFEYRANVWIWWVKLSIQSMLAYLVMGYWPPKD